MQFQSKDKQNHRSNYISEATYKSNKPLDCPQIRIYNRGKVKQQQFLLLQKKYEQEQLMLANMSKISPNSYIILTKKINQQLEQRIKTLSNNRQTLDYDAICKLLNEYASKDSSKLNSKTEKQYQVLNQQLYLLLCNYNLDNDPTFQATSSLFKILLDPYNHSIEQLYKLITKLDYFSKIEEEREHFLIQNQQCSEQTKTIQQLLGYWRNARARHGTFHKKNILKNGYDQPIFKPKINKNSEILARKNKQKYLRQSSIDNHDINNPSNYITERKFSKPHYELLYNRKLEKDKPKLKTQISDQCTFRPHTHLNYNKNVTTQQIIQRLYHIPNKSDRNITEQLQLKQLKNCTFRPQILSNHGYTPRKSKYFQVKNYEKSIGRLAIGRSKKQQLKQAYDNLGAVKNINKSKTKIMNPPSMLQKQPKIILQIKVDENRVEKIKIFGNEDPKILAKKFVLKNGLDQDMIEVVQNLVQDYCKHYL